MPSVLLISEKAGTRYMVRDYRKYFEPFDAFGQYLVLLYDIALIRLEKAIQFSSGVNGVGAVERVCLPKLNDHHVNEELRVMSLAETSARKLFNA